MKPNQKNRILRRQSRANGFSLIELLVVIAITTVLLTLLFQPLVQGFNFTKRAQAATQAQDSARVTMELISRELGSAAGVRDTSHNYLNFRIYTKPVTSPSTGPIEVLAHAYDAYIDIVPPRVNSSEATVIDPTVDRYTPTATIGKQNGSNSNTVLQGAPLQFPLAPGSMIIRYFVGLRHPINSDYVQGKIAAVEQPYVESKEKQIITSDLTPAGFPSSETAERGYDNPYILYRAEVSPTKYDPTTKAFVPNTDYFATDAVTNQPVLDDPDFFRVFDYDYGASLGLTNTQVDDHNQRVYNWFLVAKTVVDVPDLNLLAQRHDGQGNVVYDNNANGYPAGLQTEPISATANVPVIRTTVSFSPATVSNNPMAPTATADQSQGYGTAPSDVSSSYIPIKYAATDGQWQGRPAVTLTNSAATASISTYIYQDADVKDSDWTAANQDYLERTGDLIEIDQNGVDLFNISRRKVLPQNTMHTSTTKFVDMTVDADQGTVNFSIPAVPTYGATVPNPNNADPNNPNNPYWAFTFDPVNYDPINPSYLHDFEIHLKPIAGYMGTDPELIKNSPLDPGTTYSTIGTIASAVAYVANSRVVVNSDKVYGPEQNPGVERDASRVNVTGAPASYPVVPYRRIPLNPGGAIGNDQYMIDYDTGIIYLGGLDRLQLKDPATLLTTPAYKRTVLVSFNYQNNIDPVSLKPFGVRATYQTGSRLEVAIGLRLFDPSSSQSAYYSLNNAVAIGNASR